MLARRAFTLIELLTVIAVVSVLIGLLLPAVQKVRDAAARVSCRNNLKQLVLGLHNYEGVHGRFPEGYRFTPPSWSFVPPILPYIEQPNIRYDLAQDWDAPVNQEAAKTPVKLLFCPSVPEGTERVARDVPLKPAVSDYTVYHGVNPNYCDLVGWPYYTPPAENGAMTQTACRLIDIRDGTTQTMLVVEDGGRPELYRMGRRITGTAHNGGWSDPDLEIALDGSDTLTTGQGQGQGPCVMNCTNDNEMYSFHRGGANVAYCDGGVRFLRETVSRETFAALVTKSAGDVPGHDGE